MDFWQWIGVLGLMVAFIIGGSEFVQVYFQRKVIMEIRDMMVKIDINAYAERAENASKAAIESLENALHNLIYPLVEKMDVIDMEQAAKDIGLSVKNGIAEYGGTIDLQVIIDSLAASIVEAAQQAVPEMIQGAGAEVEAERDRLIASAREDPLGTALGMAAQAMQARAAQPAQAAQTAAGGGVRQI